MHEMILPQLPISCAITGSKRPLTSFKTDPQDSLLGRSSLVLPSQFYLLTMKTKQPLPFAEPVITDADKKKMEEVKRSVGRVEVISGIFIISLNFFVSKSKQ